MDHLGNLNYKLWSSGLTDEESFRMYNPNGCYQDFLKSVKFWDDAFKQWCEEMSTPESDLEAIREEFRD